ncbi:MAG TPA: hypothetical protein VEZ12_04005, partial [Herpetosiphonaceae bacterium]|nr:hypothetical protein [Herpetosiphonaceae bacterium]
ADGSELRKPHARAMPHLMRVNNLTGSLVNGYRTLNVLGITPKRRGVLSHRLFSSKAPGFVSEPHEVQVTLHTISTAIAPLKERMSVTWILDTGFDDVAVWRTIWEQHEHVVCRLKHTERLVRVQDKKGHWQTGAIAKARKQLRFLGTAETMLVVQRGRQNRPKEQRVAVELWACRGRLRSATTVRREGAGEQVEKELWLLEVRLPDTGLEPWLLLTDWEVESKASAARVVTMERQR